MSGKGPRLQVAVGANTADFDKKFTNLRRTADRRLGQVERRGRQFGRKFEQEISAPLNRINGLMTTFGRGLLAGMGAGSLGQIARTTRSIVSEFAKLGNVADMIGVGVEDLQRLRYGFETTGVAVNDVDTGMRRFARRIGEAANGGGQLFEVLKANNVQLRNADGSMRSQIDLLRDYADLIKNAGSHQERLALAFKAFDVGGAAMVDALKDGADGLNKLMDKTEEAGGVISEELIRRAQEFDTEWGAMWRRFEIGAKSAVMNVVSAFGGLEQKMSELGNHDFFKWLVGKMDSVGLIDRSMLIGGGPDTSAVASAERHVKTLEAQIENLRDLGFSTLEAERELAQARARLEQEVAKIMAGGGGGAGVTTLPTITVEPPKKTIIPGGGGGGGGGKRDQAAAAALREAEAVKQLIDSLAHELSLVGASDLERAKANASRQAGAAATDDQRKQIDALVTAIHEETEAVRKSEQANLDRMRAIETGFNMVGDSILSIADGSATAEEAVKRLAAQLALAVAQAALLGSGPLAGLFGGTAMVGGMFRLELRGVA